MQTAWIILWNGESKMSWIDFLFGFVCGMLVTLIGAAWALWYFFNKLKTQLSPGNMINEIMKSMMGDNNEPKN